MTEVTMRRAGIRDIATMLDCAHAEGWNPGLEDAEPFFAADPDGFFVAEADGQPVASISVVNHSDDFAFLGCYICRKEFRGRGIGIALWKHGLEHAGPRTVGLDGVAAQESNYSRSGFVREGATVRFEGFVPAAAAETIRNVTDADAPDLFRLDETANGLSRRAFLRSWQTSSRTRKTVVACDSGKIIGFATIRACRRGAKIGPIVAPDVGIGLALLRSAAGELPSGKVIVDIPSRNREFAARLQGIGFSETFRTARMYRGPRPKQSGELMAIATMELG